MPMSEAGLGRPIQVLALSGGGYRGLFTASILEELEKISHAPLRERFDLIIGTSIGGIIACGLATGIPMADILRAMLDRGPDIFDRRMTFFGRRIPVQIPRFGLIGSRYTAEGLKLAVNAVLGERSDLTFDVIEAPLMIVAVNYTKARHHIFMSKGVPGAKGDPDKLIDGALATSAAPTYFPEHPIGNDNLVDGGLVANAPDLIGCTEAMVRYGAAPSDIYVLSIGTVGAMPRSAFRSAKAPGVIGWVFARGLVDVTMAAQEALTTDLCRHLLPDRYVRFNPEPNAKEQQAIGLDRTDARAIGTLQSIAKDTWDTTPGDQMRLVGQMMRHTPIWMSKRGAGWMDAG
jgi:hypothetical protein